MRRQLIYWLKSLIHKRPALYGALYNVLTFNPDRARQMLSRRKYPSRFGGMWTDADNYDAVYAAKTKAYSEDERALIKTWHKDGYAIMPGAIDPALIDAYQTQIKTLSAAQPSPLLMTSAALDAPKHYDASIARETKSIRIVDDYVYCEGSRALLFHSRLKWFLQAVFERPAMLTQSLRFEKGSEQALHQDTAFVRMTSAMQLAAVWIALEDIRPGSGELIYLPGSHRWEGFLFSGRFKHYDEARDGPQQLADWHQWILDEAKSRNVKPVKFSPKKGDVFFWHAALAHGGGEITVPGASRLSLVGHYCPQGVRPLYHFYKPSQRKIYTDGENKYTSSYY